MKPFSLLLVGLLISCSLFSQETWMIDNAHSNVRFEVGWEEFSMRTGEFKVFDGSIITNSREDLSDAVVEFKVDASSVDVIADRLADHIKSDKFLDVENFPEIVYVSNEAVKLSDGTYTSKGKLTVRGVTKDQDVSLKVKGSKETRKGFIYGVEVSLEVDKTDFGLEWGSPRLANKITLVGHLLYKLKEETEE